MWFGQHDLVWLSCFTLLTRSLLAGACATAGVLVAGLISFRQVCLSFPFPRADLCLQLYSKEVPVQWHSKQVSVQWSMKRALGLVNCCLFMTDYKVSCVLLQGNQKASQQFMRARVIFQVTYSHDPGYGCSYVTSMLHSLETIEISFFFGILNGLGSVLVSAKHDSSSAIMFNWAFLLNCTYFSFGLVSITCMSPSK